jgi:glc operon protein GlcG
VRTRFELVLQDVELAVRAGLSDAESKSWAVTVAVVDAAGTPLMVVRMDDASPSSFNTAIEKARSAALIGAPTKMLEDMVTARPALLSMARLSVEGGVPILYRKQKLGGIGVSGVQSHQDAQVAEAALAALNAVLEIE